MLYNLLETMRRRPEKDAGETVSTVEKETGTSCSQANPAQRVRARDEFMAAISHELRTPVHSMLGFSELLLDTNLEHQQRDYLNLVKENCQTLLRTLNNLNDLSRLEIGKLRLRPRAHKPRELVQNVLESLWIEARKKNIDIDLKFDKSLPEEVIVDGIELRRILHALLQHAVQVTEEGSVFLEAFSEAPAEANDAKRMMVFKVRDQGTVFTLREKTSLFDVMNSLGGSSNYESTNLALQLSVARKLSELFGGQLSVQSAPGNGNIFHLSIPCQTLSTPTVNSESSSPTVSAEKIPSQQMGTACPLRILVVEDEPMNQLLIRRLLSKMGYSADIADNGKVGVKKLQDVDYQVILMDIQMPEMDGLEATRHIRAGFSGEEKRGVFISAVTAYAMSGDRERCFSTGMNDYITKPINPQKLRDVLLHAFQSINGRGLSHEP
jgi:CheY-like chemotaxis protein